jgi:PAS domain S-box-containing protein
MSDQDVNFPHETPEPVRLEKVAAHVVRLESAFHDLRSQTTLLQALASAADPTHDVEFFHAMIFQLAAALEVNTTVITEFTDDTGSRLRVLAGIVHGEFLNDTVEYDVPEPGRSLVSPEAPIFVCPTGARSRVPHALLIKDRSADGACWVAVLGTAGHMLGVLLLLHERPLRLTAEVQSLLRLFAARAGTELERRRADAARQESEIRFSAFMHHLPGVVFMKDQQGRHVYVNHAFEQLFGLTRNDWYGKTNEQLFPASLARMMSAHDRAVLHEEQPIHIMERTAQTGDNRTWLVTKFPLRLREDTPPMLAGIALDVTSHQQTLQSLHEGEDRYRRLVNVCPNAIVIQREGRIVFVNVAAMTLFGAERDEQLLGHSLFELFHPDDAPILAERISRSLDRGENMPLLEKRIVRLDGTSNDVEVAAARFADGNAQAIQVLLHDITHRKWADQVIRSFARDRQRLVDERHRLCVNLHDGLLQHLYAIGMSLEACQAHVRRTSTELRTIVPHTITQLNGLIHELRQFLLELSAEPWPGGHLAGYLRELTKTIAHPRATRLRTIIDDKAADGLSPAQCAHIVSFLKETLSNCLRHAQATRIVLSLRRIKKGVRLTVRDNGIGFDPQVRSRRGHGLAAMAARAQEIGGQLKVSSKLGDGTRIVLEISNPAGGPRL